MNIPKKIQQRILQGTTTRRDVRFPVSAEELSDALGLPTDHFRVTVGPTDVNDNLIRIHISWAEEDVG